MRRDERDDEHDVIVREVHGGVGTFLVGLAVGAVVALLVAPQSGTATRREIRRRAEKARRQAVRAAEEIGDTVRESFRDAREFVEEEVDSAKELVANQKRHVGRAVEAGREAARQTRANLERRVEESKAAYEAGAETVRSRRSASSPSGDEQAADR